ncbi:MAG: glycosyl transferase group 1 [Bacteroidetes bacterium]|jgi:glycosyltransferase involved in cell wall biosynthesis|nr:glycosyl transferase group 1 [Bacteroidota bacterium]
MPNVLILCAHRPRRSPSQRYRFEQYLPFLEQKGYKFTWSYLLDEKADKIFYSPGKIADKMKIIRKSLSIRRKDKKRFGDFDIIFIQREAQFLGSSYYEKKAFESGAKVIFDFDDSIWLADTSPGNKKWEWVKKPEKFFNNIRYAHVVIAGNKYLAEKAKEVNTNTVIIPTTIDTNFHVPKPELRNKEYVTIGWSGSHTTIKHFELLLPVLKKLKDKYKDKVRFKVIGAGAYSNPELEVESVAWSEASEVNELNSLDIGIMPLPDDKWANGKCGLKGLSYMACEVPPVMSSVGVNKEIIQDGKNGFLISEEKDWFEKLSLLIDDRSLREKLGREGRKTVIENYSVEANKQKYLDVFKSCSNSRVKTS